MKKIPIEREKSDVRISSSEREEARPKVKILFLHGFFASGQSLIAEFAEISCCRHLGSALMLRLNI